MARLEDYHHFAGRHWETGTVCNYLDYLGCRAPHTIAAYSEALLLGLSGGIIAGYFSFAYEGHDPHVAILTRNTFDPLQTLLRRLGVIREIRHTASAQKGESNLIEWAGLIVHVLAGGPRHFCEVQQAIGSLSARMLAARMKELEAEGLVARTVETGSPVRVRYALTEKGRALEPALRGVEQWARKWMK